ncbi:hypothetical protein BDV95DRAFT_368179 [Massariosphaeria phaeospora]|uniref:NAD(P)-binding protein n=1 Tax=Massariosphaeria phaeospora TaxID=100035 RepID=A0A7C8IFR0_9PLEO|nr:hypothetical protein BDV95DRAFT_368179 [Massariosphaeria phaeospora]
MGRRVLWTFLRMHWEPKRAAYLSLGFLRYIFLLGFLTYIFSTVFSMAQLTWLVTGCSSGLGEALVRSIIARGDIAIATTRGAVCRVQHLAEIGARTYNLDVTAPQVEIDEVMDTILEENGEVDVLVNNAGYIEAGVAEESCYGSYIAQFETNFFGVVKTTQALLPHFRRKRSGTIVSMGSMCGLIGESGAAAYCSTKFALEGMHIQNHPHYEPCPTPSPSYYPTPAANTKFSALPGWHDSLRKDVAHLNIRTIIFEPGFFRTRIVHPDNVRFNSDPITDYDCVRGASQRLAKLVDGRQPGDPAKAAHVMVDVVRGEGVGCVQKGRTMPARLPIGRDAVEAMRRRCLEGLALCEEWGCVVGDTDFGG